MLLDLAYCIEKNMFSILRPCFKMVAIYTESNIRLKPDNTSKTRLLEYSFKLNVFKKTPTLLTFIQNGAYFQNSLLW